MESKQRIMFFGDSLVEGHTIEPAYRFSNRFANMVIQNYHVINAGRNGDRISHGLERFEHCLNNEKPQIVCICIGGNDFFMGTGCKDVKDGLTRMIKEAKHRNITVVLLGFCPPIPGYEQYLGDRAKFFDMYEELALQSDIKYLPSIFNDLPIKEAFIPGFNFSSLFQEGYFMDSVHPNKEGNAIIAKTIYNFLKQDKIIT